jgi:hypothetical protein
MYIHTYIKYIMQHNISLILPQCAGDSSALSGDTAGQLSGIRGHVLSHSVFSKS